MESTYRFVSEYTRTNESFGFCFRLCFRLGRWTGYEFFIDPWLPPSRPPLHIYLFCAGTRKLGAPTGKRFPASRSTLGRSRSRNRFEEQETSLPLINFYTSQVCYCYSHGQNTTASLSELFPPGILTGGQVPFLKLTLPEMPLFEAFSSWQSVTQGSTGPMAPNLLSEDSGGWCINRSQVVAYERILPK